MDDDHHVDVDGTNAACRNSTLVYVPLASDFIYGSGASSDRISDGGIAGIVIGCFVFVLLCIIGVTAWIIYKRRGYSPVDVPSTELVSQQVIFSIDDVHDAEARNSIQEEK